MIPTVDRLHRRAQWMVIAVGTLVFTAGSWWLIRWQGAATRPDLSFCRTHCGLTDAEINDLIEAVRSSGVSREEAFMAFRHTFADDSPDADPTLCDPCVQAILIEAIRTVSEL